MTVLILLILTVLIAAAIWRIQGGQWFVIQTPSMGRAAPVGTLVFTEPTTVAQLHVGDVITYRPPPAQWETYTHRIVSITGDTVRTRGDINGAMDPWTLHRSDIVGKVVARWWGIGWLVRGLPILAAGSVLVGLISRYLISVKHRAAFRLFAGSVVFSIVGVIIKPYVGFVQISAIPVSHGVSVTLVSTGILPLRVSSQGVNLDLVAGQVGSITGNPGPAGSGLNLATSPHMSWPWWVVCLLIAASPTLWVLIFGAAPVVPEPSRRLRPSRAIRRSRLVFAAHHRRRWAAAVILLMLGTYGGLTASTKSAFVGSISNSKTAVGSNTYFTCTEAGPGIDPVGVYFVWPMDETSTASPARDISGNSRAGTYSGTLAPNPQDQPCARDAGGSITFGSNGVAASTTPIDTAPDTFTESIWFQSTVGGRLIGLGDRSVGTSTVYDGLIWMDDTGHVVFGTHNTAYHQAISPLTYNDNNWHQAVASLSSAGMALYVDGALVATNAATTGTAIPSVSYIKLRTAVTFAVIGSAVTSSGTTVINGDLGVTATATSTGFPPGIVNGQSHIEDAEAAQAKTDAQAAYDQVAALTPTGQFSGDQNGVTFGPGVYHTGAAFALTGTMTLDAQGDPNAVFVFQIDAAMNTAAASHMVLANGAHPGNVYFQATGAVGTGANSTMVGTILGNGALTLGASSSIEGRAVSVGASTMVSNAVDVPRAHFRVGYDNMVGVPDGPTNPSFTGNLGFAAVYFTALTAKEIKTVYIAGT